MADQNINSIPSFGSTSLYELQQAIGITQFPDISNWYQSIGGLTLNGGTLASIPAGGNVSVPFSSPYEKALLGIWITPLEATGTGNGTVDPNPAVTDLTKFKLVNGGSVAASYFWFALGV